MHFDDRLATVLQHRADGERMARVQFRQLLDLLGDGRERAEPALEQAAFRRLDVLSDMIPSIERQRIAAESAARLRNPRLVAFLASREADVASAALSQAVLEPAEWDAMIPDLPVTARGLLRHRASLPQSAWDVLDRLGAYDRALPFPVAGEDVAPVAADLDAHVYAEAAEEEAPPTAHDPLPAHSPAPVVTDLGALVRRIEAFQKARRERSERDRAAGAGDEASAAPAPIQAALSPMSAFLFTVDNAGRFDWCEAAMAAPLVGSVVAASVRAEGADLARLMRLRRPVVDLRATLVAAPALGGTWVIDCAPRFDRRSGAFTGYVGRMRRPAPQTASGSSVEGATRVRQLLHELRTPVTAIQGFAEVIQQQTMGPVPHDYRALAAGIAGDAARMLAGFAEIERLAQLEAGQHAVEDGASDFALVIRRQVARLQTVLSPRVARIDCVAHCDAAPVGLAVQDAETLAWRFLGTLAAATSAGETFRLDLSQRAGFVRLVAFLPSAIAQLEDVFAGEVRIAGGQAITRGLFGAGFALRLARAEARAHGGDIRRHDEDRMILTLPLADAASGDLTEPERDAERADN